MSNTSVSAAFLHLLSDLRPLLKKQNFVRSRNRFSLHEFGNVGVIEFQRSQRSTREVVIFTINFGIFSTRLANFYGRRREVKNIGAPECHFSERVGRLLTPREDMWWSITSQDDRLKVFKEIENVIFSQVIPEITSLMRDEDLRDRWLYGREAGTTNAQRLEFASVLSSQLGPREVVAGLINELRGLARDQRRMLQVDELAQSLQIASG